MPKKNHNPNALPTLIQEHLRAWGASIRSQRVLQRIRAADLCARMEISEATLRRIERGDPGAGVGLYLIAFQILGILDDLAPAPAASLWMKDAGQRVRLPSKETDGDYF